MNRSTHPYRFYILLVVLATSVILSGCSNDEPKSQHVASMPNYVQSAPMRVQESYEFAVAHPEDLEHIPCFCGCGGMGHTSNLSCYVKEVNADGAIAYDNHAAGCGICVDITQDVMRLKDEGQSSLEIRHYIDARYGSFGPSTDTALPPA